MLSENTIYTLLPVNTVGCYYTDTDGNPWTTFKTINYTVDCEACGEVIEWGYVRGKLGDEHYYCDSHIQYKS